MQLNYKILKWLKTFKKYNTEYTLLKIFNHLNVLIFHCIMAHLGLGTNVLFFTECFSRRFITRSL